MGKHKLPKQRLSPAHEAHIRESRLYWAVHYYGDDAPVDGVGKMWAERYADDVQALLSEIDALRTDLKALSTPPVPGASEGDGG